MPFLAVGRRRAQCLSHVDDERERQHDRTEFVKEEDGAESADRLCKRLRPDASR